MFENLTTDDRATLDEWLDEVRVAVEFGLGTLPPWPLAMPPWANVARVLVGGYPEVCVQFVSEEVTTSDSTFFVDLPVWVYADDLPADEMESAPGFQPHESDGKRGTIREGLTRVALVTPFIETNLSVAHAAEIGSSLSKLTALFQSEPV